MIRTELHDEEVVISLGTSRQELALAVEVIIYLQRHCDTQGKVSLEKFKAKLEAQIHGTEPPSFNQ